MREVVVAALDASRTSQSKGKVRAWESLDFRGILFLHVIERLFLALCDFEQRIRDGRDSTSRFTSIVDSPLLSVGFRLWFFLRCAGWSNLQHLVAGTSPGYHGGFTSCVQAEQAQAFTAIAYIYPRPGCCTFACRAGGRGSRRVANSHCYEAEKEDEDAYKAKDRT